LSGRYYTFLREGEAQRLPGAAAEVVMAVGRAGSGEVFTAYERKVQKAEGRAVNTASGDAYSGKGASTNVMSAEHTPARKSCPQKP